jgi:drug/metabolite transporter (DMT)-like permease
VVNKMRWKADLTLLFVAIIWGLAFGAQRAAANIAGVWWFNGARFLLAGLVLLPFAFQHKASLTNRNWPLIIVTSLVLTGASALQQAGLRWTSAANAGFITSLYVVLVPLVAWLVFHRKTDRIIWVAAILALIGAVLLSTAGKTFRLAPGDGLELAGALLWAFHLILVGQVVKQMDVLPFVVIQYFIAGLLQSLLGVVFELDYLPMVGIVWWAVAYTGIVSVAVGYTLQARAQRIAPPPDAALILSTESVFAAIAGFVMIGETLVPVQILGCSLILIAVLTAQIPAFARTKIKPEAVAEAVD